MSLPPVLALDSVACPYLNPALILFFCARIKARTSNKQVKCSNIGLQPQPSLVLLMLRKSLPQLPKLALNSLCSPVRHRVADNPPVTSKAAEIVSLRNQTPHIFDICFKCKCLHTPNLSTPLSPFPWWCSSRGPEFGSLQQCSVAQKYL